MNTYYWGKSITQEAFSEIIRFGLQDMRLKTIEAKMSPNNQGEVNILSQTGFIKEAHYKNRIYHREQFLDIAVYTLHIFWQGRN